MKLRRPKSKELKEPKDLGIVIGTPEQSRWKIIQQNSKQMLEQSEMQVMLHKKLIEIAEQELASLKQYS